jgi:hypothetical protein
LKHPVRILRTALVGLWAATALPLVHAVPRPLPSASAQESPADDCMATREGAPWWAGFNDATLNVLQLMAERRADADAGRRDPTSPHACQDIQISASYIQLHVISARLAILRSMHGTVNRQIAIVEAQDAAGRGDATQVLRTRQTQVAARIDTFQALARIHVDALRALSGVDERQLLSALAPALKEYAVPRYRADIPASLPPVKPEPLESPDGAAGTRSGQATSSGWAGRSLARLQPDRAHPDDGRLLAGVDGSSGHARGALVATASGPRERHSAEQRLLALRQSSAAASMLGQLVSTRRLELETTRQRQQLGHATELESSERYYLMLLDTERLTAAVGEVAMAWIGLHQVLAGQLNLIAEPGEIVRRELLAN